MSTSSHDRAEIAEAARSVTATATAAGGDRAALQLALGAATGSFGSGEVDQAFLSAYAAPARTVLENQVQVAAQLEAVAERLGEMGGAYTRTEDEAVRAADQVPPPGPEPVA